MGIKRRIGHKLKQGVKNVYHAATDPTVIIVEHNNAPIIPPPPQPRVNTFYVERHTIPATFERCEPVTTRAFRKLSTIETHSHYHSYSNEYDFSEWDALKRFGRALTNLYFDGYCHRIGVSVSDDELNYIRQLIIACRVPVIPDSHSTYRALARVFLDKYDAYMA